MTGSNVDLIVDASSNIRLWKRYVKWFDTKSTTVDTCNNHSLITSCMFSPFPCAERCNIHLDIDIRAVMNSLSALLGFSGSEYGDQDLCKSMCDDGGTVCKPLLRQINGYISKLVLSSAI
jgi:hypothetical protein